MHKPQRAHISNDYVWTSFLLLTYKENFMKVFMRWCVVSEKKLESVDRHFSNKEFLTSLLSKEVNNREFQQKLSEKGSYKISKKII